MVESEATKDEDGKHGGEVEKRQQSSCCPRDSLGPAMRLHEQKPQGTIITIDPPDGLHVGMESMKCYVTGEPIVTAKRIVVVFTDVFGLEAGHHRVFADLLAERLSEEEEKGQDEVGVDASTTTTTTTTSTEEEKKKELVPTAVIVPDMFRGNPILQPFFKNENFSKTKDFFGTLVGSPGMIYRIKTYYPPDKVEADIFHLILPYLCNQLNLPQDDTKKSKSATTNADLPKLACVGFCFGGWVVGRVLGYRQRQSLRFQCGVGIHPSFQPNLLHGETPTTMAERIHRPILLLPALNDVDMKPGTKIIKAIETNLAQVWLNQNQNTKLTKSKTTASATSTASSASGEDGDNNNNNKGSILNNPYDEPSQEIVTDEDDIDAKVSIEFPTMIHGWVARGDPTDPEVAAEQERALQLTVQFIRKHTATDDQASVLLEQKLHENAE